MQGGLKNELDCIKAFSETDFTADLKKFDIPHLLFTVMTTKSYRSMFGSRFVQTHQECNPEGLSGRTPWIAMDAQGRFNDNLLEFLKT